MANDLAAYKLEMAEDRDVVVSNLFRSEKNCDTAMNAAVRSLQAAGKARRFCFIFEKKRGESFSLGPFRNLYYLAMLPALETPPLKDFFIMLGRAVLLTLPFFILMKIFPALKNDNFEMVVSDLIMLAVIFPLAVKLGFKLSKARSYLEGFKAELLPAFKYFLIIEILLLAAYYAFTLALAPWDLPWTNTLLFWSENPSNSNTLDYRIAALLESPLLLPVYFLSVCAVAPLIEEFLMRRWLYAAMRLRMPVAAAILLNGSLFGLMHGKDFIATGMSGFLYCWSYEKTGKIETPILVHAFSNLLALLLIFAQKIFNFSL